MKHPGRWILIVVAICLAYCAASVVRGGGTLTHYEYWPRDAALPRLRNVSDALTIQAVQRRGDRVAVTVRAKRSGRVHLEAVGQDYDADVRVGPFGTMVDLESANFTGCRPVTMALAVMFIAIAGILYARLLYRCRHHFYSYRTVFTAGMAIFMSEIALSYARLAFRFLQDPYGDLRGLWNGFSLAGYQFILLTAPFILVTGVLFMTATLVLVRHEGLRAHNLLAGAAAAALIAGLGLAVVLRSHLQGDTLSQLRIRTSLFSLYTSVYVFLEAMLIGTMVCGFVAAVGEPPLNRDFLIINGCRVGPDGRPLPLLRGRIDRALVFRDKQLQRTGRGPVFVPSGGQGPDEPVSEARCMADYLLERGVPDSEILLEDRSASTEENMRFSKALIEARQPGARVGFSTSSYHVFRTGLLSREAGLKAEGMGSRTRWYYLPNAFVREFLGLLFSQRGSLLRILFYMAAFFALLSLTIV